MKHNKNSVNFAIEQLGQKVSLKRSGNGMRDTAAEIGISPATLSRIERGYMPDIGTFQKVCDWLNIDPGEILGSKTHASEVQTASVHFRKKQTVAPETAQALAQLILAVQNNILASE
jgi:transcriptional regulator with XRE-family HTH domain